MKNVVLFFALVVCLLGLTAYRTCPPVVAAAHYPGDTTVFLPNSGGGWSLLASYISQDQPDSVDFELILRQDRSTDWRSEQLIGTIAGANFLPQKSQKMVYHLLVDNEWTLKVLPTGQCYLYQVKGSPLPVSQLAGGPFVLPLKLRYKNK